MSNLSEKYKEILSSAPVNVEALIRLFNIELDKNANLAEGILGEIRKKEDGRYKISVKSNDHYFRQRFTMAHELGHFLLHSDKIGEGVDDSVQYRSEPYGNFYNQYISTIEETEANKFAAGVLMPEELLIPHLERHDWRVSDIDVKGLATRFQVSPKAMEIRLQGLAKDLQQAVSPLQVERASSN